MDKGSIKAKPNQIWRNNLNKIFNTKDNLLMNHTVESNNILDILIEKDEELNEDNLKSFSESYSKSSSSYNIENSSNYIQSDYNDSSKENDKNNHNKQNRKSK